MIRFTKAKMLQKAKPRNRGEQKAALDKLYSYLNTAEPEAIEFLVSFWNTQAQGVTYKELREAYLAGEITPQLYQRWTEDYSRFIQNKLAPLWDQAAQAGAAEVSAKYPHFVYEPSISAAMGFIKDHGAELVTNIVEEQRRALNAVVAHISGYTAITPDEAARIIRPTVGLTVGQTLANARHRKAVEEAYLKAHPNCNPETAKHRAAEFAARYAGRQHRYRAQNIARTELAFAYNAGHYGATKDAQAQGYIGDCTKTYLTAADERVCRICGALDGEKRNMDELFSFGKLLPPAHPSCRCAVAYEEIPGTNLTPTVDSGTIDAEEQQLEFKPEEIPVLDDLHPAFLGGVPRGKPMTFEEADTFRVNPNYGTDIGYSINCQSCVVAFEARQRGYDVSVLPNTAGSTLERLAHDTRLAWIDPATGKKPEYIYDVYADTPQKAVAFIQNTIQAGERYTIQFAWKGRNAGGHIVNIDLTPDGELRIKDNQRGVDEENEWIGNNAVKKYLTQIKFKQKIKGKTYYAGPFLIRIDDKAFNEPIVNDILKG